MQQGKDIYFQGKIYQGCMPGESRYNYPSVEVAGSHTFVDGQCVVLGTDYKLSTFTPNYLPGDNVTTVAIPLTVAHKDNSEAREKAIAIFEGFRRHVAESDFHVPQFISGIKMDNKKYAAVYDEEEKSLAKQCALLHCDEMINEQKWFFAKHYSRTIDFDITHAYSEHINFWKAVKHEIENI